MTSANIAALAADLGVELGSDLLDRPVRRVESLPWHSARLPARLPADSATTCEEELPATPLVPVEDVDEFLEYTPTSADYRRTMKREGWVAVVLAGPARPQAPVRDMLWPFKIYVRSNPLDLKAAMQVHHWVDIKVHNVLWCESKEAAKQLQVMLTDALDFRHHGLRHGFYNLPPEQALKIANEVAGRARIATFDEAERMRRLQAAVTAALPMIGRG